VTTLLLSHCRLIATMDDAARELPDSSIVVTNGWITQVGTPPPECDETIDCRRHLAIPGLINTHHHLYQTLTRGFPESEGRSLFPWLQMLYPIWAGLDEDMVYVSTRTGLAELALSGCTTCADHLYVFPSGSDAFFDAQVEAARSIGLRFHPTRGSMDLGEDDGGLPPQAVVQTRDQIMRDCARVISRYHDSMPGSMLRVGLAPCSPFSASPELMRESAALAASRRVRLHTHLAETRDEEAFSLEVFQRTPVDLLDDLGWLRDDVWLAHCVHLNQSAIDRFAERAVAVAHCPTSNMLLGSGLAPVRQLLDAGVDVGLGVDGSASNDGSNLRLETKQAVLSARTRDGVDALTPRQALRLATRGGAACLGRDDLGSIEVGKVADIVLLDMSTIESAGGQEDLASMAVLGNAPVDTVIVHGSIIVREGRLRTADEAEIAALHNDAAARLMQRWEATR
jgi:cytosine/adenosine deaminase-related metal-dependent hydrolase